MIIPYGSHDELETSSGNLCQFVMVSGEPFIGIILDLTHEPWPKNIHHLRVLVGSTVRRINTNLIFRMKNLI
jgi:hypothetical protein